MSIDVKYDKLTDNELVSLIIENNISAIEYFFYTKCQTLFEYASSSLFHGTVSEDELRNELYIFFESDHWKILRSFQGKASLKTWTYVVAIRFFMKKKNYFTNDTLSSIDNENADQNIIITDELTNNISKFELYDAIKKMSNERYRYLIFSELRGMKPFEIAESLNTNVDNIYMLKVRARKQLFLMLNK